MGRYYPICLSLAARSCLVVGGGPVACRKAQHLVGAGADVLVVSPDFCDELAQLDGVRLAQRPFEDHDVDGATLVFAATDDPELNRHVARAARDAGALVNVVDVPAECDFIVPATLVRGDLTISVATGSAAPALSRRLRLELEESLPDSYADFVALLGELRNAVIPEVRDPERRRAILSQLAEKPTWELFVAQGAPAVRQLTRRLIDEDA
jgi:siroheme synthase-like protein